MAIISGAPLTTGARAQSENSLPNLFSQTPVLTRRLLIRLIRNPITIAFALMLPVLFLLRWTSSSVTRLRWPPEKTGSTAVRP